ncbi:MAG: hypothetical protein ACM3SY_21570 [Candidatus Omnitrophota bacterium]
MKHLKKSFLFACGLILMSLVSVFQLSAQPVYRLTVATGYSWRGFDLNPPNKPVIQPSVTFNLGKSGIAFDIWSSFSFQSRSLNEIDFTLSYAFKTPENYSLSIGFNHYGWYFVKPFRFKNNTTQEVYVSAGLPNVFLKPEVTVYYDFNNGDGTYVLLELARSLPLSAELGLDLSAALGYNGKQWINRSGLSDLSLGATVPVKIGSVTLSPFVNVVFIFMDEVNPGVKNRVIVGASVSI